MRPLSCEVTGTVFFEAAPLLQGGAVDSPLQESDAVLAGAFLEFREVA